MRAKGIPVGDKKPQPRGGLGAPKRYKKRGLANGFLKSLTPKRVRVRDKQAPIPLPSFIAYPLAFANPFFT